MSPPGDMAAPTAAPTAAPNATAEPPYELPSPHEQRPVRIAEVRGLLQDGQKERPKG